MIAMTTYGSRSQQAGESGIVTKIRADIQADTLPEEMPTSGAEIDGIDDAATLDAGSRLFVLSDSSVHILGEDGTWYKKGGNVG